MKVEQIYTGCLAQGAYYIESAGEAAIIDPLRESAPYIEKAQREGANIKYVFETHFHADFVSGHVDLSQKTGAKIIYGPGANADFDFYESKDGEEFPLGDIKIKVLHTPGHTLESATYLLIDENGKEAAIFSGDTLFIGDVGRPDLAQKGNLTQEGLAGMLYDSLRSKIMTLPDDVVVYPAHGAGSACGKNMSKETSDTLGHQKETNYALNAKLTKPQFIEAVLDGLLPPPQYFAQNVAMNKSEAIGLDKVLEKGQVPLDPDTFESIANHEGALVLDTRSAAAFAEEHVPNSIFIGIDGGFAPWVGALIPDLQQAIVFISDEGREEEVVTRLSRVGYDNTLGYLKGGLSAWKAGGKETESIKSIPAEELENSLNSHELNILDVRKPGEFTAEHVKEAFNLPLDYLNSNMHELDKNKTYHIHCAGGYRSMIASSILKSRGFEHLVDIAGGFNAISKTNVPTTEYVCPTTVAK
ncbi:rhodanese-like domain-containing protein [Marinoscillum sp. MHG1-6]|uniref:MBL fold metallo-hydrolase n=1 Tax=Marinoscillum sp. MHG1-6 TaxID=2959627 RepID=UPI002158356C|nr:MBL fold metallo-hydrolase [Marinoscillum sp. MHG1-6]